MERERSSTHSDLSPGVTSLSMTQLRSTWAARAVPPRTDALMNREELDVSSGPRKLLLRSLPQLWLAWANANNYPQRTIRIALIDMASENTVVWIEAKNALREEHC